MQTSKLFFNNWLIDHFLKKCPFPKIILRETLLNFVFVWNKIYDCFNLNEKFRHLKLSVKMGKTFELGKNRKNRFFTSSKPLFEQEKISTVKINTILQLWTDSCVSMIWKYLVLECPGWTQKKGNRSLWRFLTPSSNICL